MIYVLNDYYHKVISNMKKCKEAFMRIYEKDINNKDLTSLSIYISINKNEENLLKEDLGNLENLKELEIFDYKINNDENIYKDTYEYDDSDIYEEIYEYDDEYDDNNIYEYGENIYE